jgi:hypothetical protein
MAQQVSRFAGGAGDKRLEIITGMAITVALCDVPGPTKNVELAQ